MGLNLQISSVTDDFNDNSQAAIWSSAYATNGAQKREEGQMASFVCLPFAGSAYAAYQSNRPFDLTGDNTYLQIQQMVNTATHAQAYFKLFIDSNNSVQWLQENGTIYAQKTVAGVTTSLGSNTYDLNTYRWLRIREASGTTYFEYSGDGRTWSLFISVTNPIAVTGLFVEFGAGTYQIEVNPGTFIVDNFNTLFSSVLDKKYIYQIYRGSTYLGMLPNVISDFYYSQDINTPGTGLQIEVGDTADRSHNAVDSLTTEALDPITTESGEIITTERDPDIIGNSNSNILIRDNNDILVYEFSSNYPSGKLVFSGFISKYNATFGTDKETISITCLSNGQDLDHKIIKTGGGAPVLENLNDAGTSYRVGVNDKGTLYYNVDQTFAGTTATISSARFKAQCTYGTTLYVNIFQMLGATPDITTDTIMSPIYATVAIPTGATASVITATFTSQIQLQTGATYYLHFANFGNDCFLSGSAANPYASGQVYTEVYNGLSTTLTSVPTDDIYFGLYAASQTTSSFTGIDPTTMLRQVIDNYVSQGGDVVYTTTSTDLTGTTFTSYTFRTATALEGVKQALAFAPEGFYWFVDPGSNTLYFKLVSTTADHRMILGKHIQSISIEGSVEPLVNEVYFSGGDTGSGVNLYTRVVDTAALTANANRSGLARLTDSSVTDATVAATLANNYLNVNNAEVFRAVITINDAAYDTELFKLGQTLGFGGVGNFIDSLLLQITTKQKHPDYVTLVLGNLPARELQDVDTIRRNLIAQSTLANPSTPS
jgi:hypothetical protein